MNIKKLNKLLEEATDEYSQKRDTSVNLSKIADELNKNLKGFYGAYADSEAGRYGEKFIDISFDYNKNLAKKMATINIDTDKYTIRAYIDDIEDCLDFMEEDGIVYCTVDIKTKLTDDDCKDIANKIKYFSVNEAIKSHENQISEFSIKISDFIDQLEEDAEKAKNSINHVIKRIKYRFIENPSYNEEEARKLSISASKILSDFTTAIEKYLSTELS